MPKYDWQCNKCGWIWEIEKILMSSPDPKKCPSCRSGKIERYFCPSGIPSMAYGDRPPWTYNEAKKYKTAKWKGKEFKIDPRKHGDIGSANSPGELVVPKPKKRKIK